MVGAVFRCLQTAPTCSHLPVHGQHDHGADDRYNHAAQVKAIDLAHAEESADKAADHCASNAQDDGHDDAAALIAGHNPFGYEASD